MHWRSPSVAPSSSRWPSLDFIPSGTMHILLMASLRANSAQESSDKRMLEVCWSLIRCQDLVCFFLHVQTFATKVLKVARGQGTVHLTLAMKIKSILLEEKTYSQAQTCVMNVMWSLYTFNFAQRCNQKGLAWLLWFLNPQNLRHAG